MKVILTTLSTLLALTAFSQTQTSEDNTNTQEVIKVQCTNFFVTPPLRELALEEYETNTPMKIGKDRQRREFNLNPEFQGETPDAVRQSSQGDEASVNIVYDFAGINGGFPPDPSGAIGPDHYVQAVNTTWRVYDADGGVNSFPISLSSLWNGSSNDGDPIVMYDQFYDRWFISQFQTASNSILIAISVTPDPQEEYYAYEFQLNGFPDYPKYSIWGDAYYMTANSFGHDFVAFEREKMVAGDQSASMIAINGPSMPTGNFYSPLPADADGALPPVGTPNYIFFPGDNAWFGNSTDHIRIYEMNINWDNPNSSGVQLAQQLDVASFNANFTASWDDIPQPNSNQRLDAIAGIFTYRAQYRRWFGYNTVVLTMVVDIDGNNKAGIRWYELRQDDNNTGNPGEWYVFQQGTYAPDDNHNRWLASACMDDYGNIAMAYSIGGEDMAASMAATGRLKWDPLGEMTIEETMLVEGSGAQSGGNRFGDYSQMTLDPDGETFYHTGEYILSGNRRTRITAFTINDPLSANEIPEKNINSSIYQSGGVLNVELTNLPSNDLTEVQILDVKGALIKQISRKPSGESLDVSFTVSDLSAGSYLIRIGNSEYQVVEKTIIQN